jgi:serine/threonine protein kinase
MSRVLQQDIEGKTKSTFGPIHWMSPESIGQQVYSKKSDVWMFGVVVYEIVSQREPHTDIDPKQVAMLIRCVCLFVCLFVSILFLSLSFEKLLILIFSFEYRDKGLTPTIPSNCPQKLVELMQMCWKKQPQQRPVFSFCFSSIDTQLNHTITPIHTTTTPLQSFSFFIQLFQDFETICSMLANSYSF